MPELVPSYLAKLTRAEKHLVELADAIKLYGGSDSASRPYTVRKRIEGKDKREVYRLHFTRSPANTDIPLIAADAIYNLRSSMEHLIAAIAPAKDRDSLTFPVFWRGVWEPCVEGENQRRRKARHQWKAIERALRPEAIAVLKRLQPPDDAGKDEQAHDLRILNRFSNTDRHAKLPVVAAGLTRFALHWTPKEGNPKLGFGEANPGGMVEDGAELKDTPEGAVKVEIVGTPLVAIRIRGKEIASKRPSVNAELPGSLGAILDFIRREAMTPLLPFVRPVDGKPKEAKRAHQGTSKVP
jgi:hypothetical protein